MNVYNMANILSDNKGSTIIETLVSLVIIILVAIGGLALHYNTSELKVMTQHKNIAFEMANSKMEEYRSQNCTGLTDGNGTPYTSTVGTFSAIMVENIETDDCSVHVNVSWNEAGQINRDFNVDLVTYVR